MGQPEVLTEFTVEILSQLLPKAVWSKLAYQFGWTSEDYLFGNKTYTGKLWDSCKDHCSNLTFSDYSIELIIALFNQASSNKKISSRYLNTVAPCVCNGDLMLELCIYMTQLDRQALDSAQLNRKQKTNKLSTKETLESGDQALEYPELEELEEPEQPEVEQSNKTKSDKHPTEQNQFQQFSSNFLCQLTHPHLNSHVNQNTAPTYDIANVESIQFALPWLNKFWSNHWINSEKKRWRNKSSFIDYTQKQNSHLHSWFHFLVDNKLYQQLSVFMHFYLGWRDSALFDIEKYINNIWSGTRLQERQDLISKLQLHFDLIESLEALYHKFVQVHPIDREPEVIRFLTDYGKLNFSTVITDWHTLRSKLITAVQ